MILIIKKKSTTIYYNRLLYKYLLQKVKNNLNHNIILHFLNILKIHSIFHSLHRNN